VGATKLRAWSLSTSLITAEEALATGLVDEIVHRPSIEARAFVLAGSLAKLPRSPLEKIKTLTSENEVATFNSLWWNPEHRSVLDKRKK
jgi:enoyl-CoA hydratase/carnithine racemase